MKWTLRKKILTGYGLALGLVVLVIAAALANMIRLGHATEAILKENYNSILAAENMINAVERQDSAVLRLMLQDSEAAVQQFRENEAQFLQWLGRGKDNVTISGEQEVLDNISRAYSEYLVGFSRLQERTQAEDGNAAAYYEGTVFPAFRSVRSDCLHLRDINEKTMFDTSDRASAVARKAFWSLFTLGSVSVVLGLGFSLLLAGFIVRPLHGIMQATRSISEGNYDIEIKAASSDELGALARDFNGMVRKLRGYRDLNIQQIMAEKRKSEAIIQSIDDGLVVLNAEMKIEDINPTAAHIFGKQVEDLKGRHLLEWTKDENLFTRVQQAFASETVSPSDDPDANILSAKRGQTQEHWLFTATPVRTQRDAVTRVVLLLRDITRLKELDRLKSEFVMAASHELRTPLTSIGMSISLLKERALDKLDAKETELLSVADEEVRRLKALVSDLLDISKIEAGKMDIEFDSVPVKPIVERAIDVFKSQADEKSIELSCTIPESLPAIEADMNKITWVLTNLMSNALRYTDCGGSIRLSATQIGSQIHISVSDNGAGIPPEYQSRIFDKFVQVKTEKALGGSGLGLAICKEIVRAHGGTIWVESEPGHGSTFVFTVPATC